MDSIYLRKRKRDFSGNLRRMCSFTGWDFVFVVVVLCFAFLD